MYGDKYQREYGDSNLIKKRKQDDHRNFEMWELKWAWKRKIWKRARTRKLGKAWKLITIYKFTKHIKEKHGDKYQTNYGDINMIEEGKRTTTNILRFGK